MDGVMLRRTVIPNRDRVRLPSQAHLILGNLRLPDEVVQKIVGFNREVLPVSNIFRVVEVDEVRREALIDEQNFFIRLRMGSYNRMLDYRISRAQRRAILRFHTATE